MRHRGWLFGTAAVILAAAVAFAGGFLGFVTVVAVAMVVPTAVALTLRFLAGPSRPDAPKEVRP